MLTFHPTRITLLHCMFKPVFPSYCLFYNSVLWLPHNIFKISWSLLFFFFFFPTLSLQFWSPCSCGQAVTMNTPLLKAKFPYKYSCQKTAVTLFLHNKSLKNATSMQCIKTQTNHNLTSTQLKTCYSFFMQSCGRVFPFCFPLYMGKRSTKEILIWTKEGYRKIFFSMQSCSYRFSFLYFWRVSHLLKSQQRVCSWGSQTSRLWPL